MRSRRRRVLLVLAALLAVGEVVAFLTLWAAKKAREPFWLEDRTADSWVTGLAFSPGEEWLAAGYADGGVGVWSLADRTVLRRVPGSPSARKNAVNNADMTPLGQVSFTPDGRLVAESEDATIELHRLPGWEVAGVIHGQGAYFDGRGMAVHGTLVTRMAIERGPAINDRGVIQVWDVANEPACVTSFGEEPGQETKAATTCAKLAFSRAGDRLVRACSVEDVARLPGGGESISGHYAILVNDARTGARLHAIARDSVGPLAVSPVSDTIAVESTDAVGVELLGFDGATRGKVVFPAGSASAPENRVTSIAFSPDGRLLVAGIAATDDAHSYPFRSRLVVWDLGRGQPLSIVDARVAPTTPDDVYEPGRWEAMTFSPSGERLAVSFGRRVCVFHVPE